MSREPLENWRQFEPDTTDRDGRERGLWSYEAHLGFKKEELTGSKVLEIGSGETEAFSRQLHEDGVDAQVIALNPDYSQDRYRKKVNEIPDWARRSIAAIGQELPFKDESFDKILALYSLTVFASPSKFGGNRDVTRRWFQEILRVLKHGGEARIAPIGDMSILEAEEGDYKPFAELLRGRAEVRFEEVRNKDLGLTTSTSSRIDKDGKRYEEIKDVGERIHAIRMVIKKL